MTDNQMIAEVKRIQQDQRRRGVTTTQNLPAWHALLERLNMRQRHLFRDTLAEILADAKDKGKF